ncbi:hypothetical protein V499_02873 [Pseudogymnoascus sp. VKM F-103]|nr:hypothetical protein V499_02873 [Pseudogymnoascus sp. VKM F-103]
MEAILAENYRAHQTSRCMSRNSNDPVSVVGLDATMAPEKYHNATGNAAEYRPQRWQCPQWLHWQYPGSEPTAA